MWSTARQPKDDDDVVPYTQPGPGGEVSPRKSLVQSACQYDVTSRVSDFQNGEQSVHRRDIKISIYHGNTLPIS